MTALTAYDLSRSTAQPAQPLVASPHRVSTPCRQAAKGKVTRSATSTTASPPRIACAVQWSPKGRPASSIRRLPSGVSPSASATSSPTPSAAQLPGRSAERNCRARSTWSPGRSRSAASWSARGAGGRFHGISTRAATSTARPSPARVSTAQPRGLTGPPDPPAATRRSDRYRTGRPLCLSYRRSCRHGRQSYCPARGVPTRVERSRSGQERDRRRSSESAPNG